MKHGKKPTVRQRELIRSTVEKMGKLKAAGKEKSATYRQLMGNKMQLQMMLTLYQVYGLIDPANEM